MATCMLFECLDGVPIMNKMFNLERWTLLTLYGHHFGDVEEENGPSFILKLVKIEVEEVVGNTVQMKVTSNEYLHTVVGYVY